MKNQTKTFLLTTGSSLFSILMVIFVQLNATESVAKCSYLDPIIIDLLAFCGGLFLIIEGLWHINSNIKNDLKTQLTRIVRVALGFAIVTIHLIQFLHK